jgi:hypothetical protein
VVDGGTSPQGRTPQRGRSNSDGNAPNLWIGKLSDGKTSWKVFRPLQSDVQRNPLHFGGKA